VRIFLSMLSFFSISLV